MTKKSFCLIFLFGSNEFWELYKSHFHGKLSQGSNDLNLRICFYGPMSVQEFEKSLKAEED